MKRATAALWRLAACGGERLKLGVAAGVLLACVGLVALWQEVDAIGNQLRSDAQRVASRASQKLAEGTTLASALYGYYQSAGEMRADRFTVLSERFRDEHDQVTWIAYASRVDRGEVERFQHDMRNDGYIDFEITPYPSRVGEAAPYHLPLNLIEPQEPGELHILGKDLMTHPSWYGAIEQAVGSGEITALEGSGINGTTAGILLLRATYRGNIEPGDVVDRRAQLSGVIMMFLDQEKLLASPAGVPPSLHTHLAKPDAATPGKESIALFDPASGNALDPNMSIALPLDIANLHRVLLVHMALRPSLSGIFLSMAVALLPVITIIMAARSRRTARQAERSAFAQGRLAEATLGSIDDAVIRVDEAGQVRYLNPKARSMTGRCIQLMHPQSITEVIPLSSADGAPLGWSALKSSIRARAPLSFVRECGTRFVLSGTLAAVVGEDSVADGYVLAFRDVTREHDLASELKHQASHDPLTELPNRRAFEIQLQWAVDDARENRNTHTLLYVDLDQFKLVNDTCGHAAGDQMLRQLSGLLAAECRAKDVLARLGGDEFGVLLRDCAIPQATPIAQRICDIVTGFRFTWDGHAFELGASIGVVAVSSTSGTADDVQRAADLACYAAKDMGRNRLHVYRPEDRVIARNENEMKWQVEVKRAIEEKRLVLHAQPIVGLRSNCEPNAMCEVLLRMRGDDGELIPPRAFIPAAERYGLMRQLDREVVRLAFNHLNAVPDGGMVHSINLSGQTVTDPEFESFVVATGNECEINPARVCFEITETSAISNLNQAIRLMNRLRQRGYSFALDDFGAGLSSLSYLKQLPIDFLKIDGQFVRDLDHDPVARSMVSSIVNVADVLGIQCIGEMVEDTPTQRRLTELGVDYAQGFHIGRPKPLVSIVARAMIA